MEIDFLVIGVQKSATSWLYLCLKEHPELNLPKKKKEVEYIGGPLYNSNGGIKWYLNLFDAPKSKKEKSGDVSVEYIFNPKSPEEIKKYFPKCKLVVLLRNPVERFKSAYFWYLRKGISDGNELSMEMVEGGNGPIKDLLARGCYAEQIENYRKHFDTNQMHFVFYEDIKTNPADVLRGIFSFLDVKEDYKPASITVRPKKNSYNKSLIWIEKKFKSRWISALLDQINQRLGDSETTIDPEVVSYLYEYYAPHNERLMSFFVENKFDKKYSTTVEKWDRVH